MYPQAISPNICSSGAAQCPADTAVVIQGNFWVCNCELLEVSADESFHAQ